MSKDGIYGDIIGGKELEKKFLKLVSESEAYAKKAVTDSTFIIHGRAVKLIQANSSGTRRIRYGPKRSVIVSKPGSPPNTDTGRLVQSIKFDFEDDGLTGIVGTNLKYGKALEMGTKKMEPRPWLSTAVRQTKKEVSKIFTKYLKMATGKAGK